VGWRVLPWTVSAVSWWYGCSVTKCRRHRAPQSTPVADRSPTQRCAMMTACWGRCWTVRTVSCRQPPDTLHIHRATCDHPWGTSSSAGCWRYVLLCSSVNVFRLQRQTKLRLGPRGWGKRKAIKLWHLGMNKCDVLCFSSVGPSSGAEFLSARCQLLRSSLMLLKCTENW